MGIKPFQNTKLNLLLNIHINNKIELGSRQKRIFELESEISKLNPLSSFKTK
jgi:hypothetical protein